jgi:hypothetical protein
LSTLRQLVKAELARRENGAGMWPSLCFVVDDADDAITDIEAAKAAIVARAGHIDRPVYVAPAISEAVTAALRAAYPRRFIIMKTLVESPHRRAERPMTENYEEEVDRAVARAAERLAALRQKDDVAAR